MVHPTAGQYDSKIRHACNQSQASNGTYVRQSIHEARICSRRHQHDAVTLPVGTAISMNCIQLLGCHRRVTESLLRRCSADMSLQFLEITDLYRSVCFISIWSYTRRLAQSGSCRSRYTVVSCCQTTSCRIKLPLSHTAVAYIIMFSYA